MGAVGLTLPWKHRISTGDAKEGVAPSGAFRAGMAIEFADGRQCG